MTVNVSDYLRTAAVRDPAGVALVEGSSLGGSAERRPLTWQQFDVEQFQVGLNVEMEHGSHDPETNVTNDDPLLTGKIAWAHLKEFSDYYTRLMAMEQEADAYWGK